MTWNSHFLVDSEEVSSCLFLLFSLYRAWWNPGLADGHSDLSQGKPLDQEVCFFFSLETMVALCENKGIWMLFRKNVTYNKQIALENFCLTLGCLGQTEGEPHPMLLSWRRHLPQSVSCLWLPQCHCLFPCPTLPSCSGPKPLPGPLLCLESSLCL